jgi:HK97 family phage major capsid protein
MKVHMDQQQEEIKRYGQQSAEREAIIQRYNDKISELESEMKSLRSAAHRPIVAGPMATQVTPRANMDAESARRHSLFFKAMRHGVPSLPDFERGEMQKLYSLKNLVDPDERERTTVHYGEGKAMSLGDETTGGYLAPPEFVQDIIKGVQLISPIRPLAQVRTTSRRSVQYPVRSGVFQAKWVSEVGTRSETAGLTYALEEIPNHELYADVLISDQDLEDSVFNIEQEILDNCTEQFAKAEGSAFVNGSGVGQPEGLQTNAGISATNQVTSATGAITAAGLIQIWADLKTVYAQQATWLLNRQSIASVRSLVDLQNRYLWEPGLADGTPPNLLGSPYIEVPDMPNIPSVASTTSYPIMYGNIKRGYMIVDRINVVVRRLQERYAESGQIAYLVRKRVGGQVVLPEAIRKLGAVRT